MPLNGMLLDKHSRCCLAGILIWPVALWCVKISKARCAPLATLFMRITCVLRCALLCDFVHAHLVRLAALFLVASPSVLSLRPATLRLCFCASRASCGAHTLRLCSYAYLASYGARTVALLSVLYWSSLVQPKQRVVSTRCLARALTSSCELGEGQRFIHVV